MAVFVLSTLACSACAADDIDATGAGEPREVTVVLDWTPNTNHAGLYLAAAEKFYADAGLAVTIIEPGENGAEAQLLAGNADFIVSYAEAVIPARASGAPIVSVAAIIGTNTSSLLSPADRGITEPADLAGVRYGGFGGELETALISKLVECDGGDPDSVDYVQVGNVDYLVGFENNDFDVAWIFDGWDGIRLTQAGLDTNTIAFRDHQDCIPNWYTPLLATTETIIDNEPDLVRDFLTATAKGYELAIDEPTKSAETLLAAVPELDEELVRASAEWLAEWYATEAWGIQDAQTWSSFSVFLLEAAMIDETIDIDAAFTNEFLPS